MQDVDDEIDKVTIEETSTSAANANTLELEVTYPSGTTTRRRTAKLYKSSGQNEDGSMTQKAITSYVNDAVAAKADTSYVDNAIASIPAGGGGGSGTVINFGSEAAGRIVVVDENGALAAGDVTETSIIDSLLKTGVYAAREALGLEVNYTSKTNKRTQEATNLSMGTDFDAYTMYGGRMRCTVEDDGTITAFYGDANYTEDGSIGQVMVYQPKFYYQRIPLAIETTDYGTIIKQDSFILSTVKQAGFKVHPFFDAGNGDEYDYALFSAYEGSIQDNKLASLPNVKPVAGLLISEAEQYAANRGTGWHISTMAAESAQQMLEIVEFGTMNGQEALEAGISNITAVSGVNCASLTGSTASLGNATGHADSTINEISGTQTTYSDAGYRAISYRGVENPWGNLWHMIGGLNLKGDSKSRGGAIYICKDFNYTPADISANYESVGFTIPSIYGWISALGYGSEDYDWVLMPIECSSTANSLAPVGDNLWSISNVTQNQIVAVGGSYSFKDSDGPFYYACDRTANTSNSHNYGSRLIYIPTKNSTYTANIAKWTNRIGG